MTELPNTPKTLKTLPRVISAFVLTETLTESKRAQARKGERSFRARLLKLSVHLQSRCVDGTSDSCSLSVLFPSHPRARQFHLEGVFLRGRVKDEKKATFVLFPSFVPSSKALLLWALYPPVLEGRWPPALGLGVVLMGESAVVVEGEEVLGQTLVSTFR